MFFSLIKSNRKIFFSFLVVSFLASFVFVFGVENPAPANGFTASPELKGFETWVGWKAVLVGIVNVITYMAAYAFYISALIFDNLLAISLSTGLFELGFVKVAWSNIRDFANVFFVLGAMAISLQAMFDKGKWQTSLVSLLVVALILNFSLFFSRVIVDAGNITARVFYTSLSVTIDDPNSYFLVAKSFYEQDGVDDDVNLVSVGAAFMATLRPEALLGGTGSFELWLKEEDGIFGKYMALQGFLIFIFIMFAKSFFVAGFMFISRMLYILKYMILSPIYFVAVFLPINPALGGGWSGLQEKWLFPLLTKSFCIAFYLFFIWLAVIILKANILGELEGAGDDFILTVAIFALKGIFAVKILDIANTEVGKMCENGESLLGAIAGSALKLGRGVISNPVTHFAGRHVAGGLAHSLYAKKDSFLNRNAAEGGIGGFLARRGLRTAMGVAGRKFGGVSYVEKTNAGVKDIEQLKKIMGVENAKKMSVNMYGKDKLKHENIKGFTKEETEKEYYGIGEGKLQGDALDTYKSEFDAYKKAGSKDEKDAAKKAMDELILENVSSGDRVDLEKEREEYLNKNFENVAMDPEKGNTLLGKMMSIIPAIDTDKHVVLEAEEMKASLLGNRASLALQREHLDRVGTEAVEAKGVVNEMMRMATEDLKEGVVSVEDMRDSLNKEGYQMNDELDAKLVEVVNNLNSEKIKMEEKKNEKKKVDRFAEVSKLLTGVDEGVMRGLSNDKVMERMFDVAYKMDGGERKKMLLGLNNIKNSEEFESLYSKDLESSYKDLLNTSGVSKNISKLENDIKDIVGVDNYTNAENAVKLNDKKFKTAENKLAFSQGQAGDLVKQVQSRYNAVIDSEKEFGGARIKALIEQGVHDADALRAIQVNAPDVANKVTADAVSLGAASGVH